MRRENNNGKSISPIVLEIPIMSLTLEVDILYYNYKLYLTTYHQELQEYILAPYVFLILHKGMPPFLPLRTFRSEMKSKLSGLHLLASAAHRLLVHIIICISSNQRDK